MQLVLDTKGLQLTKKSGIFHVQVGERTRAISPGKLSSIAITANVQMSTAAILLALKHRIPILLFDNIGRPQGRFWSPYFSSIATLRRKQVHFAEIVEATNWLINLFDLKTDSQVDNLKYIRQRKKGLSITLTTAITTIKRNSNRLDGFRTLILDKARSSILGVEGNIARVYWQAVGNALPRQYRFQGRSRRPAEDNFNAALNYMYGMLYTVVEGAIFAAGLDPHLGLFHVDAHDKPTLAFDLIEPFRPWVDRLLIKECFNGNLENKFFTKNRYGIFFNKHGKAYIIPLFNDFLRSKRQYLGQESTVKNHIHFLAGSLAQRIRTSLE